MRFKIEVREQVSTAWWETYDEPSIKTTTAAKSYGQNVVNGFNHFLRPGEQKRYFTGNVQLLGPSEKHEWRKTNLVTIARRGTNYDTMRCEVCGATGKRYGLGAGGVRLDSKFKKWIVCQGKP